MNSISKYITPATIAATLVTMRSGRKEIFLVCEGGTDIALYSQVFGLPRSNFVSCRGKGNLMDLFALAPTRGLDAGTILLRDRDHDSVRCSKSSDTILIVTELYDIEMYLLHRRLFKRLMQEYLVDKATEHFINDAYRKIVGAAAWIGALRLYATRMGLPLDFADLDLNFISAKDLSVDINAMVRKVFARSKQKCSDFPKVVFDLEKIYSDEYNLHELSSGKDVLRVMQIALSRYYKCCNSSECSPDVTSRIVRIAAAVDDLRETSLFAVLIQQIESSGFKWPGHKMT